jgi:hypothetical protein
MRYGLIVLTRTAWTAHFRSRDLPAWEAPSRALRIAPLSCESWLGKEGVPDGTPYLLSHRHHYDAELTGYAHRANQVEGALNTTPVGAIPMRRRCAIHVGPRCR